MKKEEILTGHDKRVQDQEDLKKQNADFLAKCKTDKKKKIKFPKAFANNFGSLGYVTWTYNGIPVTAYFDGQDHEYPEFVADWLQAKINYCLETFYPVNEESELF